MASPIGASVQSQAGLIQNNLQKSSNPLNKDDSKPNASVAKANANQKYVNLAQDIISQRASAPVETGSGTAQAVAARGQLLDVLV